MSKFVDLGKSQNGNKKVAVDVGTITGTVGKSSNGNKTIRLYGNHIIDGQMYFLTGNLTLKGKQ